MSCGNPHATDCREVLEAVYVYLDGEADSLTRKKIAVHLDECGPCLRQYGLEQAVKSLVARCCRGDHAPDGLRVKVMQHISTLVTTDDAGAFAGGARDIATAPLLPDHEPVHD
jgi:mycothiol system anti-sigma-R factor